MNNQEENNWYAIHRPEDPEGDAQIAKNMAYAAETGALKPKPLISIEEFRKKQEADRVKRQYDSLGDGEPKEDFFDPDFGQNFEYATDPNTQMGKPQGSFGMNGVQYKYVNGKWTAMKPDGTPMNDAEMYQHTSQMHQKKPGNVTGRPLLPSRLFQKPTIAQR